jgi:acyl dehydratase
MSDDALRDRLLERIGQPMGSGGPVPAPDPVNLPMIRHWVDAFDDRNPVYLDPDAALAAGFAGFVAPPAMLQAWTMPRPRIEGIRERGGAPGEVDPDTPVAALAAAGFRGTLATNSELEFDRYLLVGEELESEGTLTSISELKGTGLGVGYFVEWMTTFRTGTGEEVGRQRFRIFKFDPTRSAADLPPRPRTPADTDGGTARERVPGATVPEFALDVTATVIVAGALATRDFMPVHHDRDYAQAQGAPDVFMNILSTNAYIARYVTDWAGPRARLTRLAIRLGAPCVPGQVLTFTGQVTDQRTEGARRHLELGVRAANAFGDHATGTVELTVPV